MRTLLLLCTLAACDRSWRVEAVETARPPMIPTGQCIEAGIKETGLKFTDESGRASKKPVREWNVNGVRVQWDPRTPTLIEVGLEGVGTEPTSDTVSEYRRTRVALTVELEWSCDGKFDMTPEKCHRVKNCGAPPPMTPMMRLDPDHARGAARQARRELPRHVRCQRRDVRPRQRLQDDHAPTTDMLVE